MSEEMIPSPSEKPDPQASKKGKPKSKSSPSGDEHKESPPKASRPRPDRIPNAAEIVAELKRLAGLTLMGVIPPAKGNMMFRCISKIADIEMRSSASGPSGAIEHDLTDACRNNPKLVDLIAPLLTEDQLDELMRQLSDGDDA